MSEIIQKRVIDITGIELKPGEPTICLGNGEQGFECCCDECDYYLLCFPEFDSKSKENNISMDKKLYKTNRKMTENVKCSLSFLSLDNIFFYRGSSILREEQDLSAMYAIS